jgi:hypothetical protein
MAKRNLNLHGLNIKSYKYLFWISGISLAVTTTAAVTASLLITPPQQQKPIQHQR